MMEFILYGCAASFLTSNGNDGFKILYLLCIMTLRLVLAGHVYAPVCKYDETLLYAPPLCLLNVSILEATRRVGTFYIFCVHFDFVEVVPCYSIVNIDGRTLIFFNIYFLFINSMHLYNLCSVNYETGRVPPLFYIQTRHRLIYDIIHSRPTNLSAIFKWLFPL